MKKLLVGLAAMTVLMATSASAHHSFAMFDNTKLTVIRGTLISFSYLNPHAWISILGRVDDKAPPMRWDIEATSPLTLTGQGIRADTLKPGDKLTVAIRPLRDGRPGGSMVFVITPDGIAHGAKPSDLGLDSANLKP